MLLLTERPRITRTNAALFSASPVLVASLEQAALSTRATNLCVERRFASAKPHARIYDTYARRSSARVSSARREHVCTSGRRRSRFPFSRVLPRGLAFCMRPAAIRVQSRAGVARDGKRRGRSGLNADSQDRRR